MSFLTDILAGKAESDIERGVDRAFLNYSIHRGVASFFDPDKRKRELEEKLLDRALTSDSYADKIKTGIKWAAALRGPGKATLAKLLSQ